VESAAEDYLASPTGRDLLVVTPTNAQAHELVERLARRLPTVTVAFMPAQGRNLPAHTAQRGNVIEVEPQGANAPELCLLVATADKLASAVNRGGLIRRFSGAILDEAFQTSARQLYALGDIAPRVLLVGDPGQLSPFSDYDGADRWRGQPCDPLQTAAGVLKKRHPGLAIHQLPLTRRLPASAVPVAQAFYPDRPLAAWTLPGARKLRLAPARGRRTPLATALDTAATHGWAYLRMPPAAVYRDDPATVTALAQMVHQLLGPRAAEVSSERTGWDFKSLEPQRVAVATSHRDQRAAVREALDELGLTGVVVDTANGLQGLEFDVVFAWHPLAAQLDADGFHLDPGRLCVMLTRHRHACIVVGRADDRRLLESAPPLAEATLDDGPDSVLDGWYAHRHVLAHISQHAVDVS
jgi:hypothetical protein